MPFIRNRDGCSSLRLKAIYGILNQINRRFRDMNQSDRVFHPDILIVGSGITGVSIARELSRYDVSVTVIDRGDDIAEGATKANSGIVHAGYDAVPGTSKAYFNVRGAAMYPDLCKSLSVPYRKCGALVIGFDEQDLETLEILYCRGIQNGVKGLRLLSRGEALEMEPALNPEICGALDVPESGIVSPYELAYAMADDAALNGVSFLFRQEVISVCRKSPSGWRIETSQGSVFTCKVFINCSGSSGADLHNMISDLPLRMTHRRGQYYLLDRSSSQPFRRTVFQCPSSMGKGVLVSPTVHGNLLLGPNAEDIDNPMDTATTSEGLSSVLLRAERTWPAVSVRSNITNFSGVRAHLDTDDFVTGPVSGAPDAFEAIGIESPGLSSAPAVAVELSSLVAESMSLVRKPSILPPRKPLKPFHDMDDEERAAAVRSDPLNGNIICRCEIVTEAEIREAIRRPVGARTVDGVKRRTRAGMGRCQGGFCSPRVASIISEETGLSLKEITKDGGESRLLADTVESFLKGGSDND